MDKEPITKEGLQKLKEELDNLKNIERPKIVAAIAEARSHGDLKENAEYHAAKEQQAKLEGRVLYINDSIARANVIDVTKLENSGKVIFGSTIKVKDLNTNNYFKYHKFIHREGQKLKFFSGARRQGWLMTLDLFKYKKLDISVFIIQKLLNADVVELVDTLS